MIWKSKDTMVKIGFGNGVCSSKIDQYVSWENGYLDFLKPWFWNFTYHIFFDQLVLASVPQWAGGNDFYLVLGFIQSLRLEHNFL